jgi:hypothetical protein
VRCYVIEFGAWNLLALEAEFETLAECERLFAEWLANLSPEFWKKWNEPEIKAAATSSGRL